MKWTGIDGIDQNPDRDFFAPFCFSQTIGTKNSNPSRVALYIFTALSFDSIRTTLNLQSPLNMTFSGESCLPSEFWDSWRAKYFEVLNGPITVELSNSVESEQGN